MSKQANITMIGAFVVGAVALVVAGVLVFGSGKFLKEKHPFVLYFQGSVQGLDVGASVDFRGVKIGTVTDILLRSDPATLNVEIPVFIEIEGDRFRRIGRVEREPEETMKLLIEKGLRAKLQMQSLVTGKLMIELDFYPDKPAKLYGLDPNYLEIPTVSSDLEELAQRIKKAPIEEILEKLHSAVAGIEKVVNSPEILEAVRSLEETLKATQKLVRDFNNHIDPLAAAAEQAVKDAQNLMRSADTRMGSLASTADDVIKRAALTIEQAEHTLRSVEDSTGKDSALYYEANRTLEDLAAAARSIRLLADYLNQHPESLLRGKGESK